MWQAGGKMWVPTKGLGEEQMRLAQAGSTGGPSMAADNQQRADLPTAHASAVLFTTLQVYPEELPAS